MTLNAGRYGGSALSCRGRARAQRGAGAGADIPRTSIAEWLQCAALAGEEDSGLVYPCGSCPTFREVLGGRSRGNRWRDGEQRTPGYTGWVRVSGSRVAWARSLGGGQERTHQPRHHHYSRPAPDGHAPVMEPDEPSRLPLGHRSVVVGSVNCCLRSDVCRFDSQDLERCPPLDSPSLQPSIQIPTRMAEQSFRTASPRKPREK